MPFGEQVVHYFVGPASCAVPGLPAGIDALWRAARAAALARRRRARAAAGARRRRAAAGARPLARDARAGDDARARRGHLRAGRQAARRRRSARSSRGSSRRSTRSPRRAPRRVYEGTLADALLGVDGVAITRRRPGGLPGCMAGAGGRLLARDARRHARRALGRPRAARPAPPPARRCRRPSACSRLSPRSTAAAAGGSATRRTSSPSTREGRACVITHSLGVGSGDFLPDARPAPEQPARRARHRRRAARARRADGEHDGAVARLRRRRARARDRRRPAATRLRTALFSVAAGILDEGLEPQAAVDRPRFHPTATASTPSRASTRPRSRCWRPAGRTVRRWPDSHHYFGGVCCVGRNGPAADPRRSGAAVVL